MTGLAGCVDNFYQSGATGGYGKIASFHELDCLFATGCLDGLQQIRRRADFLECLSSVFDRKIGASLGSGMGGYDHCISGFQGTEAEAADR